MSLHPAIPFSKKMASIFGTAAFFASNLYYNYDKLYSENKKTRIAFLSSLFFTPAMAVGALWPWGKTQYRENLLRLHDTLHDASKPPDAIDQVIYLARQYNPAITPHFATALYQYAKTYMTHPSKVDNTAFAKSVDDELFAQNPITHCRFRHPILTNGVFAVSTGVMLCTYHKIVCFMRHNKRVSVLWQWYWVVNTITAPIYCSIR